MGDKNSTIMRLFPVVVVFAFLQLLQSDGYVVSLDKLEKTESKRPLLYRDNRVLNGPLGRSLFLFARTAHSLRSTPLRYARSLH